MQQRRVLRRALYVCVVLLGIAPWAQGADSPVQVEALGVHADPRTGARYVAAQFTIADGWHLYWQHPGDSGQAPSVDFAPSDATKPALWPRPTRLQTPPLASYGYDSLLVLPAQLLRDDADLTADVHWLACAETCVPGHTQLKWSVTTLKNKTEQPQIAQALSEVPDAWPQTWRLAASRDGDTITLAATVDALGAVRAATFFPDAPGGVDENQPKFWGYDGTRLTLRFAAGRAYKASPAPSIDGVLVTIDEAQHARAWTVHTALSNNPVIALAPAGTVEAQQNAQLAHPSHADLTSFVAIAQALVLACLGGMLLNLMPCVFPVLSVKVLGYVNTSGAGQALRRRQAWWYALGNILTLTSIGAVLLGLRAMGQSVGWGFQMQSPVFVMAMALLMFVMGLSQLGLLSLGGRLMGIGQSRTQGQSDAAAFWTGVLTVVVATPCSAPFMGVATAVALAAPAVLGVAIFAAIGLGVALPYLALCHIETLARRLPRPGLWMVRLREASGLCLWGSCIWLLWIAGQQCGPSVMAAGLVGCLLVGTAAWLRYLAQGSTTVTAAAWLLGALGAAASLGACYMHVPQARPDASASASRSGWQPYSAATLAALRAAHTAVFIDFTAAWCVSCQVNEALVLNTAAADTLFAQHHVVRLKADWTDQNTEVAQALAQLGRSSVPLYVVYPSGLGQKPIFLPAVLTPAILQDALAHAH